MALGEAREEAGVRCGLGVQGRKEVRGSEGGMAGSKTSNREMREGMCVRVSGVAQKDTCIYIPFPCMRMHACMHTCTHTHHRINSMGEHRSWRNPNHH